MKIFTLSLFSFLSFLFSAVRAQNNALSFDGINDRIIVAGLEYYDFEYGTVEVWVKPQGLVGNACVVANRGYDGTRYSFHMSTTAIGLYNGYIYSSVPYASTAGQWYHLAFVCTPWSTDIYVNGAYIGQTDNYIYGYENNDYEWSGVTGQEITIGGVRDGGGDYEFFKGEFDDLRIWNYARSPMQINSEKNQTLSGAEPGLVALFNFDQGVGGGNNSGINTVTDDVFLNDGYMQGFAMTGASSNFTSRFSTLPVELSGFKAIRKQNTAVLQWQTATEQNSESFVIERSSDGNRFTAIGTVRAAGNSNTMRSYSYEDAFPLKGKNYYRLKQVDIDGRSSYSDIRILSFITDARLSWFTSGRNATVSLQGGSNEEYTITNMSGATIQHGRLENGRVIIKTTTTGIYNVRVMTITGIATIKVAIQ